MTAPDAPPDAPAAPAAPEDDRLWQLAADVANAHAERRRLPVVRPADALALVDRLHVELDRAMAGHRAAAEAEGLRIACGDCHGCCENVVITHEPEALRIAAYLRSPDGAEARAHFARAFPVWRARLAPALEAIARPAPGQFHAALAAAHRARVPCAFLRDGRCTVYAVRPWICRGAHALDTSAHCGGDHTEEPRVYVWGPLMELIENTRPLHGGMHAALRGAAPPEPVCTAVHRLLGAADAPGRNDPCPCGSGRKHKKCCGA